MTTPAIAQALEAIYASLNNNNEALDAHIATLKTAMQAEGMAAVTVEAGRLPQPNRQGRKLMQSYFKKRGVTVNFAEIRAEAKA